LDGLAGVVVVPDRGGRGGWSLVGPRGGTGDGVSAVFFEIELPPWWCRGSTRWSGGVVGGTGPAAVVVLVRDRDLVVAARQQGGVGAQAGTTTWRSVAFAPVSANPTGRD